MSETQPTTVETYTFNEPDTPLVTIHDHPESDLAVIVNTPAPWDTPDDFKPANEIVKQLDYNTWSWNDDKEVWDVYHDNPETLIENLETTRYDVINYNTGDTNHPLQNTFESLLSNAETETHSTAEIRYEMKNGNGENSKTGDVIGVFDSIARAENQYIEIQDADSTYTVHFDPLRSTHVALYSESQHPYMGEIKQVRLK